MANVNLTARLGITQQQLADYLGVHRSVLSMYECGLRQLPAAAALKLNQMELLLIQGEKKKTAKAAADKKQLAKMASHLQDHIYEHTAKARTLQRQLTDAKKRHQQHTKLLQLAAALLARPNLPEQEKAWANVMASQATVTINTYGEHVQATMLLKLNALNQQLKDAAKALDAIKN